jgi:hypothetical protein
MKHVSFRRVWTAVLVSAVASVGCVKTREYKVARYEPGTATITQPVPRDGVYKLRWKVRDDLRRIPEPSRYLLAGTEVGFETEADGTVVALVGDQRIDIGQPPRRVKYCMWHSTLKEETRFGRAMRDGLMTTGYLIGTGMVFVLEAYLSGDDCAGNQSAYQPKQR